MNKFRAESLQKISFQFPHFVKEKLSGKTIAQICEISSNAHPMTILNLYSTIVGNVAKNPSFGHNTVIKVVDQYVNEKIDFKEFKGESLLALLSI